MATTKTAPKKTVGSKKVKTAPKAPAKKTSPKKKKKMVAGAGYECSVCGLAVSVDSVCGCDDTCDIVCCGEPMERI